jgi:hypothetical protein
MRGRRKKIAVVAAVGVGLFLAASLEQPLAQGLGGLGQLLGGGGSTYGRQYSGQPNYSGPPKNAVTVERNIAPFIGKFSGKQKAPSYEGDLNANFACYPALDAALPNDRTFVCYTAEEQQRLPE